MEPQDKPEKLRIFLYGTLIGNVLVLLIVLFFVYVLIGLVQKQELEGTSDEYGYTESEDCSVSGINVHGTLVTYIPQHAEGDITYDYDLVASEDITWLIEQANQDENTKAVVIEVDSSGGSPVAGEEIANAVKNSEKPVVAFIRDVGASAAYLAISSADKIWASENSNVGSIGVTASYLSNAEKNRNEGYKYENLSIGKYKDSGSPEIPLTKEDRELFLRDLNIMYENFIAEVAENRNLAIEKVRSFADGSTVLGAKAKELGLIDEIGGINEAKKYLEETIGETLTICWQ
jgi:protease IV